MADERKKNYEWSIGTNVDGTTPAHDALMAILMDIRDEMQKLNTLLGCDNFLEVPQLLRAIKKNTTKSRSPKS